MITKLLLEVKKWALLLLVVYTLTLTITSLMHLKSIPSLGSSFDDKIYHSVAYFIFTLLMCNYGFSKNYTNTIKTSATIAIVYGIIIEVLQYVATSHRTFDVYDAVANALGALIAVAMLIFITKTKVKID